MTVRSCVAKLPGLMQQGPPHFVDPTRLADTRDNISGVLDIDEMSRLHGLLSKNKGLVEFKLYFEKDTRDRINISGQFHTKLWMQCQRCLQPVEVDIEREIKVVMVADEAEAAQLSREMEPLVQTGRKLSLLMFFEDELLLSLPLAAYHNTDACHAHNRQQDEGNEDRHHPFTILKDLQLKNSKD